MTYDFTLIHNNLELLHSSISKQLNDCLDKNDDINLELMQISEFIDMNEYGLAYEYIIGILEEIPLKIEGNLAIKLLEVGLLFGFKSNLEKDHLFDFRKYLNS